MVDEAAQLLARLGEQHPAADVQHRALGLGEAGDDGGCRLLVERRLVQRLDAVLEAGEQRWIDRLREDVHRHIDEDRPGLAVLGEEERLVDDLGEQLGLVDPPGPLDERPVDLELGAVGVEVDLLVGMSAEVVRRNVAGDDDHRDAVEGGVGDAGRGVREPGTEVAEDHRRSAGDSGVAVGGVGGDLFVTHVDELDRAVGHRRENGDVGVPAQPEDVADATPFEMADELLGNGRMGLIHGCPPPY